MLEQSEALYKELFAGHDPALLKVWQSSTVGIIGCGGLGSNVAVSLTRAGIGCLVLADFDNVSVANLCRQQFYYDQVGLPKITALKINLSRISPYTQVVPVSGRITPDNLPSLFSGCDILVEAVDDAAAKQMLIEAWQELYPERPLIGASGLAGYGRNELIRTIKLDNIYLCGDGVSELQPGESPVAPRVAIVANLQANLCLELLVRLKSR